jgi:DNA-binding Xre family transcriptional regulator
MLWNMKINFKLIKEKMADKKWNQTDLADEMGVTRQSVCNQFRGGVKSLKTIERYARALKMKPKDIII